MAEPDSGPSQRRSLRAVVSARNLFGSAIALFLLKYGAIKVSDLMPGPVGQIGLGAQEQFDRCHVLNFLVDAGVAGNGLAVQNPLGAAGGGSKP